MKVRAQKSGYNTALEFDDFLLKEFSKDKEKFEPDTELSCCECFDSNDEVKHEDSAKTFLIKFKADNLGDPQPIKPGVKGFILPEDGFTYTYQSVTSNFQSIRDNHYNLNLNRPQIDRLARILYGNSGSTLDFSQKDVADYLTQSCLNKEWQSLYNQATKSKWKKFLRSKLREKYKCSYGEFNKTEILEALKIDRAGITDLVSTLRQYDFLEPAEKVLLKSLLP